MSRGIEKIDADKMLIKGFFNEVIKESSWDTIHDSIAEIIESKYMNIVKGK
jgi:Fe-S cluster assembly scaffold protein SufB